MRAVVAGEADLGDQSAGAAEGDRRPLAERGRGGGAVAGVLRRVPELRPPAARRRARAAGAELRASIATRSTRSPRSVSASRRAPSCRRSTGPAIRRRRISIRTIRTRRRSCWPRPAIPNGLEIETLRLGRSARDAAPGNHHLATRQGRHPRQADGAGAAAGGAGLHDREEGRDVDQPVVGLSRSEPALRGAVRQDGAAQCRRRRAAGLPRTARRDHGGAGSGGAQGGVRQAAALRRRAGAAAGAVHLAGREHRQPEGDELRQDSLLTMPKFPEVWLQA